MELRHPADWRLNKAHWLGICFTLAHLLNQSWFSQYDMSPDIITGATTSESFYSFSASHLRIGSQIMYLTAGNFLIFQNSTIGNVRPTVLRHLDFEWFIKCLTLP